MKSIKMTHINSEGETLLSLISYDQFENSFVKERWEDERRTLKTYTMFCLVHTKTTVTNPYNGKKSIRTFEFSNSYDEALKIHNLNLEF